MRNTATIPRRIPFAAPTGAAVPWAGVYISATLIIWTVSPFLRRIVEWKSHFAAISPFGALPLVVLVPAAAMLFAGRARRINKSFETIAVLWVVGFSYALIVAALAMHFLAGVFTYVSFCLPLAFGLWVATRVEDTDVLYARFARTSIVLAVIASVYGIIQYVVVPPWDAAWLKGVDSNAFGYPLPFQVRVFSMLNSPATLAAFLTFATIMFLPRMTIKSGLLLLPVFLCLGLTSVRAGWITLFLSVVIFSMLTTRRAQVLKGFGVFVGAGVLAIAIVTPLLAVGVGSVLQNRLLTLTDIAHDQSAGNRAEQISDAFTVGINDPEGSGLGAVGVATRLNSAEEAASNLDSGYLSRFVEMGIPGTLAFLASLGFATFAAARVWRLAVRNGDAQGQDIAAVAVTLQIAMLLFNFFGDASTQLPAILAWTSLGLILRNPAPKRVLSR